MFVKNIGLIIAAICISVLSCSAQPPVVPVKSSTTQTAQTAEISETEWKILTDALQAENWQNASYRAQTLLERLKIDNEKKQIAQLRYFYLYSLAGKILEYSTTNRKAEQEVAWKELEQAARNFTGREFVLPPRRYLGVCREVVNYVCAVNDNEKALRITATNRTATAIHSFEYIAFDEKVALDKFSGREVFLGGQLKKVEFNRELSKPWVMRLTFEKGFAQIVVPK